MQRLASRCGRALQVATRPPPPRSTFSHRRGVSERTSSRNGGRLPLASQFLHQLLYLRSNTTANACRAAKVRRQLVAAGCRLEFPSTLRSCPRRPGRATGPHDPTHPHPTPWRRPIRFAARPLLPCPAGKLWSPANAGTAMACGRLPTPRTALARARA
ncbi:hypothetical protein BD311DRAFT_434143 [Dichomitus squalens]|uniref:Uncharacterized protein n=1 Tax=Dichomitus squalens TaxID=114155 RepID=A0A4Q9N3P4_9APHY|nr:hypothetical protein BD311DRAFT_434143 [Dichomitus squalens]